jgi:hypothetical protein
MAQRNLAFVGEDRCIERGNFSLLESDADEKADDAFADGSHVVQGGGVEVFIVREDVAELAEMGGEWGRAASRRGIADGLGVECYG